MLSECLPQLLSCSNSKIYFRTSSNYVAPEEDHHPSERVASSHIVGRRPIGTASNSESEDVDTDDGTEGFLQDSAPAMTSSQLSSSSASANSAPAQALMFSPCLQGINLLRLANGAGKVPARSRPWGAGQIRVYPCPLYGVRVTKIGISTNVLSS